MKKATVRFKNGEIFIIDYNNEESSLWRRIGELLLKSPIPNKIEISSEDGTAILLVKKRGTYIKDGETKPSMYVTVDYNFIHLPASKYTKAYLTCVNPESNNYKAYILRPTSVDQFEADYGSLDEVAKGNFKTVQSPYASYLYWIRYYEKISKGYIDQTSILLDQPTNTSTTSNVPDKTTADSELYQLLIGFSRQLIDNTCAMKITKAQVQEAEKILKELYTYSKKVKNFNERIGELIALVPRKRDPLHDDVSKFFAKSKDDFGKIINREESLLQAMKAIDLSETNDKSSFENVGVSVFEATKAQRNEVESMLGANVNLKAKIKRVWRVKPHAQEKRMREYCKKNGISQIRKFWHGSRNENWASIMVNGLKLNPSAKITGKMFGDGIYFAPSPQKSFGYTSHTGSCWANGTASTGFMGIYATAFGDPYMAQDFGSNIPKKMEAANKDCVYAMAANVGLRNDEVIFYNEDAICINYLVEFE